MYLKKKDNKNDLQIIQNDILRTCNKSKLSDKQSIYSLQKKANLLGLEQRRQKESLSLMYIYSKQANIRHICERQTWITSMFIFKTESKVGTKYKIAHYI